MKRLLLLCGILSGMVASAQSEQPSVPPSNNGTVMIYLLRDSIRLTLKSGKPLEPGVYRLPGGMPCLVPDTRNLSPMPNGWRGPVLVPFTHGANRIPNPALPNGVRVISYKSW